MVELHKALNIEIEIGQDIALRELVDFSRLHDPVFYKCGVIDAGIGYYQLAALPSNERILLFAINLEDLQLKEWPGLGVLFAHPEKLYGVNIYNQGVDPADIDCDMRNHQRNVKHVIREDYTLVHTGPHVYQSRAISYLISAGRDENGNHREPNGDPEEDVHIHAFVDALHSETYAAVYPIGQGTLYERTRFSAVHLTGAGPIKARTAPHHILAHHTGIMKALTRGRDPIQEEDKFLPPAQRMLLRLNIYTARTLSKVAAYWNELKEEYGNELKWDTPEPYWRILKLCTMSATEFVKIKDLAEFIMSMREMSHVENHYARLALPERLRPHVEKDRTFNSRLNRHLHPMKVPSIEMAVPLDADQARLCPAGHSVRRDNPFDHKPAVESNRRNRNKPMLNSVRAMLSTMRRLYPRPAPKMSLLMQANGLWLALCRSTNTAYVGYNAEMDTETKPLPAPGIADWLSAGKVIRFRLYKKGNDQNYAQNVISLNAAMPALNAIVEAGDQYLLRADEPRREIHPHVIRADYAKANFNAISGEYVRQGETPRKSWPPPAKSRCKSIKQPEL